MASSSSIAVTERSREDGMIEGLLLDVPAEELMERLDGRIAHHRSRVASYEAQLGKLAEVQTDADDEDDPVRALRSGSPRESLERKLREHRDQAAFLMFLREHLVPKEMYRLEESDLRTLEIVPGRFGGW
jgi:hypothetical protein